MYGNEIWTINANLKIKLNIVWNWITEDETVVPQDGQRQEMRNSKE